MGSQSRAQEGGSGIMRSNERVAAWLMRHGPRLKLGLRRGGPLGCMRTSAHSKSLH